MRHEICVADMSPVRDLPGFEGHVDTWQVQCSCGWRNFALMPEAAADEVADMHRDSYTRAEMLAFGERVAAEYERQLSMTNTAVDVDVARLLEEDK